MNQFHRRVEWLVLAMGRSGRFSVIPFAELDPTITQPRFMLILRMLSPWDQGMQLI